MLSEATLPFLAVPNAVNGFLTTFAYQGELCKQVDKVYVRIISVSLLLSLCGVGVVSPRLCRAIFISEAEQALVKQSNTASPSSSDKGKILSGCHWAKLPLRRILSSLSDRFVGMCAGRAVRPSDARCPSKFITSAKADSISNQPFAALLGSSGVTPTLPAFVCHFPPYGTSSPKLGMTSIMPIRAGPAGCALC